MTISMFQRVLQTTDTSVESTTTIDYDLYSDTQKVILGYISFPPAILSTMGSSLVIYVILFQERPKLFQQVYYRLMLGLSMMDILYSGGVVAFGPWMVPPDIPYSVGGKGNTATCNVAGFFLSFFLGSVLYSASLAFFFLLFLRMGRRERWLSQWIEPGLHFVSIALSFASAIYGVVRGFMNPLALGPGKCWVTDFPYGCASDDNLECQRGEDYTLLQTMIGVITIICILIIIISMSAIVCQIGQSESKIRSYHGDPDAGMQRTKQTMVTALYYVGASFFCFIPPVISQLVGLSLEKSRENRALFFAFSLCTWAIAPLQGLFNCWIFMRSRRAVLANTPLVGRMMSIIMGRRSSSIPMAASSRDDAQVQAGTTEEGEKEAEEAQPEEGEKEAEEAQPEEGEKEAEEAQPGTPEEGEKEAEEAQSGQQEMWANEEEDNNNNDKQ